MANYNKEGTLRYLDEQGIQYEKMEHKAVFTMEEMDEVGISAKGGVVKNLFLRDGKGKNHFLVVVPEEKRVNLSDLSAQLNASKMSFASADRLAKYLGVVQGAVSPLGVLNDENHVVEVVFDKDLIHAPRVGIHPNDNTATVWMSFKDLKKLIEDLGNPISYIKA